MAEHINIPRPYQRYLSVLLPLLLLGMVWPCAAQESLAACSKRKTQQMKLIERQRASSPHDRKRRRTSAAQISQKIEQIDVWLWKNCRYHAEEMRSIEQQYM